MKRWTEQETATAVALIARHASDAECWAATGRSRAACYIRAERWKLEPKGRTFRKPPAEPQPRAPERVLLERDRRLLAPRDLTAALLGDPPPGYSALDRRLGRASC